METEPERPSAGLDAAAQFAAKETSAKAAHLRSAFLISDPEAPDEPPPLSVLISGGGRGGGTRLALLLTLLWVNTAPPHTSNRPPAWWADVLGRPGPNGTRAIQANLRELEKRGFVKLVRTGRGKALKIEMLNEVTGAPYERPFATEDRYIRVPATLWTTKALSELGPAGLAMFLVLLYYHRTDDSETWFSPDAFRRRHHIADSTRTKGLNQLVKAGIVTVAERWVETTAVDGFEAVPRRHYRINHPYLPPKAKSAQPEPHPSDPFARPAARASTTNDPWASPPAK